MKIFVKEYIWPCPLQSSADRYNEIVSSNGNLTVELFDLIQFIQNKT